MSNLGQYYSTTIAISEQKTISITANPAQHAEIISDLTYTISPFIFLNLPHKPCTSYTNKVKIANQTMQISYGLIDNNTNKEQLNNQIQTNHSIELFNHANNKTNQGNQIQATKAYNLVANFLPYGRYPRGVIQYICSELVKQRFKSNIIKLPQTKHQFIEQILHKNPHNLSAKERNSINQQLYALTNLSITINYTNPNNSSRRNIQQLQLFTNQAQFLYAKASDWQDELMINPEFVKLVEYNAVPISGYPLKQWKNTRQADLFTYFMYQNYNLQIKKLEQVFDIKQLYQLFGQGLANFSIFKNYLVQFIEQFKQLLPLQLEFINQLQIKLTPVAQCLLQQRLATTSTTIPAKQHNNTLTKINLTNQQDTKTTTTKINQIKPKIMNYAKQAGFAEFEIEAACLYASKRQNIRHPFAYIRDVLNNPDFYLAERKYIIDQWHMKQQAQFKASSTLLNEYGNKFKNLAKQISIRPADVQVADFIGLCKMGADNWQFGAYLTWIITNDKFNQFTANSLYAKLYQFIKDNQALLNNVITEPTKTQAQTQTSKKTSQTTSPVITTQSDKPLWIVEAFNKLSQNEQQLYIEKATQIYATIPFKKLQFVNQDNLKYCVFARSNGNSYDLLTEFAVKQYSKIGF